MASSSSSPSVRDPVLMADESIRFELRTIERRLDELETKAEDIGPVWLHEAMTEDEAMELLRIKAETGRQLVTYFLIEGPHYSHEFDAQPQELTSTPAGAIWYNLHTWWEEAAPNQEAPPIVQAETIRINWTVVYDDADQLVASGYSYLDSVYDSIRDLGVEAFGDRTTYIPVENAETHAKLLAVRTDLNRLFERKNALIAEFGTEIGVLIIKGNSHMTPEWAGEVRVPRRIEGLFVSSFINEVVSEVSDSSKVLAPDRARLVLHADEGFQIVLTDMIYTDFKALLANAKRDRPLLEIIEFDRKRLRALPPHEEEPARKRRRPDLDGATALYAVGADISPDDTRSLAVYILADSSGLVVVDTDTGKTACDHVYEMNVPELCADQRETGFACPQCHVDSLKRATNALVPGTL